MRIVHLFVGIVQIIAFKLDIDGKYLLSKLLTCVLIFIYQGAILYEQLRVNNLVIQNKHRTDEEIVTSYIILSWIYIEIFCFYLYLGSAGVYLFIVSVSGSCRKTDSKPHENRFMYDAIEYYETDIDWFAF
jgi:hypothetical protein